ncbi:MAG TPA: nuclear transport factor 2 family protein [Kofleriaceae bacterium]|nr:nuclear transport factor 2 family protein [Kofleriaceae bacterium]
MKHAAIFFVALALAGCPRGSAPTPTHPSTPKETVAGARATVEQWRQAYQVKSFDALAKLYVQSLELVVVQDGSPLVGWTSVEGMLKDRFARYKDVQIRLKDIQVVALDGTSAVATASMTRELGDGVTTITESGALTVVLRKEGDLWLIVAEHYSYKRST